MDIRKVRQEATYAIDIIERWIQNAPAVMAATTADDYQHSTSITGLATTKTISDPVGEAAVRGKGEAEKYRQRILGYWKQALDGLEGLDSASGRVIAAPVKPSQGVRTCLNCAVIVYPGEPLKASRCNTCYEYRRTHSGMDRRV